MALGLVNHIARAARTVLRGASCGFAALLVALAGRLRRGVGDAASPLATGAKKTVKIRSQSAVAVESRKVETSLKMGRGWHPPTYPYALRESMRYKRALLIQTS